MSRPFIPAPNTASVELIYTNAGEVNENVFHVYKGSPFSLSDLQALRGVVDTWDSTTGKTLRVNAATLIRIRTKALDTATSPTEDYFLPTPRAGTQSAPGQALNVAVCIKLGTGLTGRSNRGRWYFGNLWSGILSDAGHVALATVTGFVTGLTTLKSNLLTGGYTLCVTSFYNNHAWRTTAVNNAVTTIVGVDNSVDSMRKRLPGRGHSI
jgi:hypothetical protein